MSKQYLYTERAHLMCPNMYFGIAEVINRPYESVKLQDIFKKLIISHPFLRALLGYEKETNQYYYDITEDSKVEIICKDTEVSSINDSNLFSEYKQLTSRDWDLMHEGMLKIVCWKMKEQTCVLFVFHHLLADGRAALGLALEMAQLYVRGGDSKITPEQLISSPDDLPVGSQLPIISKALIKHCNKKWLKENHTITYAEYHRFANEFIKGDQVAHLIDIYEQRQLDAIVSDCKDNGVSVNDYLLAKMFVEEHTNKIIIAQDIRSELKCYREGSLGNYSTAFSIEHKTKSNDIFTEAKRVHNIVKKKTANIQSAMTVLSCYAEMQPELLDSAAISALGGYKSNTGSFVGGMMFGFKSGDGYSITNLGKVETDTIDAAMFIPPASPAIKKTLGVLTTNGKMFVCSSERK